MDSCLNKGGISLSVHYTVPTLQMELVHFQMAQDGTANFLIDIYTKKAVVASHTDKSAYINKLYGIRKSTQTL
jgi:hypothetical protein